MVVRHLPWQKTHRRRFEAFVAWWGWVIYVEICSFKKKSLVVQFGTPLVLGNRAGFISLKSWGNLGATQKDHCHRCFFACQSLQLAGAIQCDTYCLKPGRHGLQGQSRLLACCALLLAPIVGREHLFDLNKFPYEVASQFLVEQELVSKRLFCGPKTLQAFSRVDVWKRHMGSHYLSLTVSCWLKAMTPDPHHHRSCAFNKYTWPKHLLRSKRNKKTPDHPSCLAILESHHRHQHPGWYMYVHDVHIMYKCKIYTHI